MILVGVGFIAAVFWEHFKHEEKKSRKFYGEIEDLDTQKFSQKLKDSRVEMGLRQPKCFKTKRKPQKKR